MVLGEAVGEGGGLVLRGLGRRPGRGGRGLLSVGGGVDLDAGVDEAGEAVYVPGFALVFDGAELEVDDVERSAEDVFAGLVKGAAGAR